VPPADRKEKSKDFEQTKVSLVNLDLPWSSLSPYAASRWHGQRSLVKNGMFFRVCSPRFVLPSGCHAGQAMPPVVFQNVEHSVADMVMERQRLALKRP
jgi:hypothetical protein